MEDFSWENNPRSQTLLSKQSNLQGVVENSAALAGETSFLQSRLNKDNFWNLMFFVFTVLGWKLTFFLNDKHLSFITSWATILLVPYIVRKNCLVTFDKEKLQFLNRDNEVLTDRAPNFFLLVVLTIGLTALVGLLSDGVKHSSGFNIYSAIFGMIPVLVPTMYCILKNYPIAVFFKKEAYIGDGAARSYSSNGTSTNAHNTRSTLSLTRLRNSPINSWHNTNIYNRNR